MLARQLHLEQINRFHDKIENLRVEIDHETDRNKRNDLVLEYFELVDKLWPKIDDLVEMDIKNKLDILENK